MNVDADGDYEVRVLLDHVSGPDVVVELRAGAASVRMASRASDAEVRYRTARLTGATPLKLRKGAQHLSLDVHPSDSGALELAAFSVELIRTKDLDRYSSSVVQRRARVDGFAALGHGFMVHYTPESFPRSGPRRPWAEAVRDFDVEAFADQMAQGGAGFVVFVTAHMQWTFPAPLRTVDAQMPGRTTERDLIEDLAQALRKRGIRLMLYLNPAWDEAFRTHTGGGDRAPTRLLEAWNATVTEIGERYGERVFGYWFDKGPWFYEVAPSWVVLHRAARAGNPDRFTAWNRSRLPMLTDFQDFDSCEKCDDPSAGGHLRIGGSGQYHGGPSRGLQAAATLLAEYSPQGESADAWVHRWPDKAIGMPRWNPRELEVLLAAFRARGNVPIFNLGIYQDGRVSERSVAVFAQASLLPQH